MLGSLLGLGTSVGSQIPGLFQGDREKQLNRLAQGKGPSAARTMLANQGAQNAANAQAVASAQPGGLGLLQGLRSAETANRDAAQQMGQARVQEQMSAIGAAKQARDQRLGSLEKIGASLGAAGAAHSASEEAADLAKANRKQQLQMQQNYLAARYGTPAPQTAVSPAQRADLNAAYASRDRGPGNAVVAPTTTIRALQPEAQLPTASTQLQAPVLGASTNLAMRGAPVGTPSGTLNTAFRPVSDTRGNAAVAGTYEPDSMQSSAASADPRLAVPPAALLPAISPEDRLFNLNDLYMGTPTRDLNRRYGR